MEQQPVIHSTFVIERSYPAVPDRVFAAFADPATKRRWFIEADHHHVEQFEMDFRVGGEEHARFRFKEGIPVAGLVCTNQTTYQDIVPNHRLVMTSKMSIEGKCISASLVTVEFLAAAKGTDLILTHQGVFFEGSGGPEMREEGWQSLMGRLTKEFSAVNG